MVRLKRVGRDELVLRRVRRGHGFGLVDPGGEKVSDLPTHERIRALGIPPAWTDVCIALAPNAHIQACGTDAAGRLQYIYHPDWEVRRTRRKQQQLTLLTASLSRIRRRVREDLAAEVGSKRLALAIGVALIDRTAMRVGRERYLDAHGTRGAGTLFSRDVLVEGELVATSFPAKSGKRAEYGFRDARLAEAIARIKAIRGKRLLMYHDAEGKPKALRTDDINRYLRDIAGSPVTAKDFRTLHGSALAAEALAKLERAESPSARKRQMATVTKQVATFLQNTPAISRASYIAPCLFALFERGRLAAIWQEAAPAPDGVRQREARLASVLASAGQAA
jgi:DNA topoisomerase-1